MIRLHITAKELFAKGNTYDCRDLLKHMGFRWHPQSGTWHRPVGEQKTLNYIMKMFEVNGVATQSDETVKFSPITVEEMRQIRREMLQNLEKL